MPKRESRAAHESRRGTRRVASVQICVDTTRPTDHMRGITPPSPSTDPSLLPLTTICPSVGGTDSAHARSAAIHQSAHFGHLHVYPLPLGSLSDLQVHGLAGVPFRFKTTSEPWRDDGGYHEAVRRLTSPGFPPLDRREPSLPVEA